MTRKLKLYSLGGAGCNIGARFLKFADKKSHGFAQIEPVFVDTSKSNLGPGVPTESVYLVDGLDGSGKLRASNFNAINDCVNEILHQFKPGDINVVLSSASGGSGSVLAPVIVSELLARDEMVVVISVGSTSSRIEAENSLKTLKSYEMIAQKRNKPVVMAYRENSLDKSRQEVDAEIETMIMILSALFSGNNRELDTSDLRNFLTYTHVTSYKPKLSSLDFFSKDILLRKGESLVTLVSLIDEKSSSETGIPTEYQAVGFLPDVTKEGLPIALPIHACVLSGYYNVVVDKLNQKINMYDENRKVVVEKSIVSQHDTSTDNGVIL